jgi:putative ATPase
MPHKKTTSYEVPLAARLRPITLDGFVGQTHLLAKNSPLRLCIEKGQIHSMLLWGPPGSGKTTLAELIAHYTNAQFIALSAVMAGVKDIRASIEKAHKAKAENNQATILFIDEIHRFNKSQQDALLPYVEDGTIFLIGATTENPSFEVINALLSRSRIYVLKPLNNEELKTILLNALANKETHFNGTQFEFTDEIIESIVNVSDGDARRLLNILDILIQRLKIKPEKNLSPALIEQIIHQDYRRFDNKGEVFYEQISALHKSVRGSSPDGAIYWLCRMLDGGCDPHYIARRIVKMASEDIGNADPRGLTIALDAWNMVERLGYPEGSLGLAQAVAYLASAPKSVAVYEAFNKAMADIKNQPSYQVPVHLRNAPTHLMRKMGYGKEYRYDPHEPGGFAKGQTYFPDELGEKQYYFPIDSGLEIKIKEKLKKLRDEN